MYWCGLTCRAIYPLLGAFTTGFWCLVMEGLIGARVVSTRLTRGLVGSESADQGLAWNISLALDEWTKLGILHLNFQSLPLSVGFEWLSKFQQYIFFFCHSNVQKSKSLKFHWSSKIALQKPLNCIWKPKYIGLDWTNQRMLLIEWWPVNSQRLRTCKTSLLNHIWYCNYLTQLYFY